MEATISEATRKDMRGGAGWMRFYCVVIFLVAALLFWLGLKLFTLNSPFMDTQTLAFMMFILGVTLGLMGYFLWAYTTKLIEAAATQDIRPLEEGLNKAKTFYIIWGVLSILGVLITVYELITGTAAL